MALHAISDDRTLSICMLSDDFVPAATGVGTHLQSVAKHLAARGHRITLVTTRRPGDPLRESWEGVNVRRVFTQRVFGFYQALPSAATLEAIFDEARPDLLHYHYLGLMLLRAMRIAARRGLPQVYTYHMTEDHLTQPWPLRPLRGLAAKGIVAVANRMDLVISVSERLASTLPAKGIKAPIKILSNPVEFPDLPETAEEPPRRGSEFVVLFAGRLNPEKNIPLLLEAFSLLIGRVKTGRLWIAGTGSQRKALEAMAARLGIGSRVEFLGHLARPELASRYRECDAFVLPSLVETQGLVAMEAMHFSKPVVVADSVISAAELVADGVNGFVFDHRRPDELADRLETLSRDQALRASMGRAGFERTLGWRPSAVVSELERLYSWTLAPERREGRKARRQAP